jgi:hypothetical protein
MVGFYISPQKQQFSICVLLLIDLGTCPAGSSFSTELQEKDATEEQCH